jgi:hypothetical protein
VSLFDLIVVVLLSWPPFYTETGEQPEKRRARLVVAAIEIERAAQATKDPRETAAALLTLGFEESRFAAYVGEGRCAEGPAGARCDEGKARGYFQVWAVACPAAWRLPAGSRASLRAEAKCAARAWRGARLRCRNRHPAGSIAGAFAGYRGADCTWARGAKRAKRYQRVFSKLHGGP